MRSSGLIGVKTESYGREGRRYTRTWLGLSSIGGVWGDRRAGVVFVALVGRRDQRR